MDWLLSDAAMAKAVRDTAGSNLKAIRNAQHEKDKAFFLPLLRGMLKITEGCGLMLEHKITDEEIALLKRVEEVTK